MRINERFKSRIAPLSESEYAELEKNLLEHGCLSPLVLWDGWLIDGHNRHEICTRHGIPYETVGIGLRDEEEALEWIDRNQIGRRNLTPEVFRLVLGRIYNASKKAQGGTGANQYEQSGKICQSASTSEALAEQHSVSERTVRNAGKAAEAVDNSPLAKSVLAGDKVNP